MFFYIGNTAPFSHLTKVTENLFLDKGWKNKDQIFFKGYSTECNLEQSLDKIINENYAPVGKWCVIVENKIYHPKLRGYPIYKFANGDFTNIVYPKEHVVHYEYDEILDDTEISLEQASELVGDVLKENIVNFLNYNSIDQPNMLYSMGLDSLTIWAILDAITPEYTLQINIPKNKKNINKFGAVTLREYETDLIKYLSDTAWGYHIINICAKKTTCFTGFYSERFQFREVSQGHAIANYLGTELYKMVQENDYLYYFLQRPRSKINNAPVFDDVLKLKKYCFDSIKYDHQMWHMDNNFFVSPFFDSRIAKICHRLSLEDICKNAVNGIIQRNIIKKFRPEFLSLLSNYKNAGNLYTNFNKNWSKIKLSSQTTINIT